MGNLFTDIRTAVRLSGEVREARKQGVEVKVVWRLPVVKTGYWGWTMEGCLLYGPKWRPVITAFETLPEAEQHTLTFSPRRPGEWLERARLWRDLLRPALPPALYHEAMMQFLRHYAKCVRMRRGMAE